jgi:hypothetical protein
MTAPFDALDWTTMSRSQWDRGLDDGEAVAGSIDIVAGRERISAHRRRNPNPPWSTPLAARVYEDAAIWVIIVFRKMSNILAERRRSIERIIPK